MAELIPLARNMAVLCVLIAALVGCLWLARRYLPLPGLVRAMPDRRLMITERLNLDNRRSLVLVQCDKEEHLLICSPDAVVIVPKTQALAAAPYAPAVLPDPFTAQHPKPSASAAHAQQHEIGLQQQPASPASDRARRMAQIGSRL